MCIAGHLKCKSARLVQTLDMQADTAPPGCLIQYKWVLHATRHMSQRVAADAFRGTERKVDKCRAGSSVIARSSCQLAVAPDEKCDQARLTQATESEARCRPQ